MTTAQATAHASGPSDIPSLDASLRAWWSKSRKLVLWSIIILMYLSATFRLWHESLRLTRALDHRSAIDFKYRYKETVEWFEGLDVYARNRSAVYPPATYVMLRPFIGYVSLPTARIIWWIALLVCTIVLGVISAWPARGPMHKLEIAALFLLPFSAYATAATFSTGQFIVALLPLLVGGVILIARDGRWWVELIGAAGVVVGLAKPTLALPFLWIVLFASHSLRPIVFVAILYAILTLIGARYRPAPLAELMRHWLANGRSEMRNDYGNLHSWLTFLHHERWTAIASPLAGLALGVWVWLHRRVDVWILIGVVALFARMWTYHRLYDDLLSLPAIVALYRLANRDGDVSAAIVLAMMVVMAIAPPNRINYPGIIGTMSRVAQQTVWIGATAFLMHRAYRRRKVPSTV